MKSRPTHYRWAVILPALFLLSGCMMDGGRVATGELRTDSKQVAQGAAKSVRVNVDMKAGELKIGAGASQLLDANFTYNVPAWKPEVRYDVHGGVGALEIDQPQSGHSGGNSRNEWDVRLGGNAPMNLTVNLGAGRATLVLGGLALDDIELNMGAGETIVDLTGTWKKDLVGRIHGGVGKATVRLPSDVGIHVIAHGGLGAINAGSLHKQGDAYVNDAYGKSPVKLSIEVEGGIGEIDLEVGGPPPVV